MAFPSVETSKERYGVKGFSSRCCATLSVNQAVPSGAWTQITLDAVTYDSLNEFDITVGNHDFTPHHAGYYLVVAQLYWNQLALAGRIFEATLYLNGVPIKENSTRNNNNEFCCNPLTDILHLIPTDSLELWGFHNVGAPHNAIGNSIHTYICIHRLS